MKVIVGKKINQSEIDHCPWNPRPEITVESVADITASILASGLLQEIGVMKIPENYHCDRTYWAIYGNRRLVACRAAGFEGIPVKIYECSEAEAREITRIENEQRLGVSPIEDAKLIKGMLDMGFEEQEIAAHFGVSNATVCRRVKLIGLVDKYQVIAPLVATSALEKIAMYPESVQSHCFGDVQRRCREGATLNWSDISWSFRNQMKDIATSPWFRKESADQEMIKRCKACMNRTGAQPDLWGDIDECGKDGIGCCTDSHCWECTFEKWKNEELNKLISPKATGRQEVESWRMPSGLPKPKKGFTFAYWSFNSYSFTFQVVYYKSPEELEIEKQREQEEKDRIEAENDKEAKIRSVICQKIEKWAWSGTSDGDEDGEDYLRDEYERIWKNLDGEDLWEAMMREIMTYGLTIMRDRYNEGIDEFVGILDRSELYREFNTKSVKEFVAAFIKYYGFSMRDKFTSYNEAKVVRYWSACRFVSLNEMLTDVELNMLRNDYRNYRAEHSESIKNDGGEE